MSGHSKWAKIKRAKGANDAKRGALFTKLARAITIAAQEGGGDPDMNFTLRLAIDKAKQANMPLDNIDRALKKGTGELKGDAPVQKVTYEGITPAGVLFLIDCTTDNTNRTFAEVKNLVEKLGAKLGDAGSVSWQFQEIGRLEVGVAKLKESDKYGVDDSYDDSDLTGFEEFLLEVPGIDDYTIENPSKDPDYEATESVPEGRLIAEVRVQKDSLKNAAEFFASSNWQLLNAEIAKVPNVSIQLDQDKLSKYESLREQLEDMDDVGTIWDNVG